MAFGLTPSYVEILYPNKFNNSQFLVVAIETAKSLGWQIDQMNESGFRAINNKGRFKFKSIVTFSIENDKAFIKSESAGIEIWDLGKNKSVIIKYCDAFIDQKYARKHEELDRMFDLLKTSFSSPIETQDSLEETTESTGTKKENFLQILIPHKGYIITPILIYLNIIYWIIMVVNGVHFMEPDNEGLLYWGANFRPFTLNGEYWRLISSCFIHIGLIHLLMNMYALIYIGLLLEPHLGKAKFLFAYLLAGIAGSTASLWWNSYVLSAGASGAIFGMYGIFLALLTTNLIEKKQRKELLTSIGIFVVYNLAFGLTGNIDNAAHIGGLLSGILIGYLFYPAIHKPKSLKLKIYSLGIVSVLFLSGSYLVYKNTPDDLEIYDQKMKSFYPMEEMALNFFKMSRQTPKEIVLREIEERGFYYWNELISLLNEVELLNLPEPLHEKNKMLLKYCRLRIKTFELYHKAIEEETRRYDKSIEEYSKQIELLMNELKE